MRERKMQRRGGGEEERGRYVYKKKGQNYITYPFIILDTICMKLRCIIIFYIHIYIRISLHYPGHYMYAATLYNNNNILYYIKNEKH